MNLDLKNKKWKEFLIGDIFNINTGALLPKKVLRKGSIARITATDSNNGVYDYYAETSHKNFRVVNNFISVSFLGSVFYHPYKASLDMKIHSVQLKELAFNKYLAHFIVLALKRTTALFSYGDQLSSSDLPKKRILLPINAKGEPDFDYMQDFTKEVEKIKLKEYQNFIKQRISNLDKSSRGELKSITEIEWREFYLKDIFNYIKGDQNHMSSLKKGVFPLVSAKNGNNGLKDFVTQNSKKIYSKNILTLNNDGDGGAGISYFQPFDFLLDNHVTALYPKIDLNKYTLSFISRCITNQRNKFGHGYSLNNNRIRAFKIMLPTNQRNEPDYEYMENYMKQLEDKKLKEYLSYMKN